MILDQRGSGMMPIQILMAARGTAQAGVIGD